MRKYICTYVDRGWESPCVLTLTGVRGIERNTIGVEVARYTLLAVDTDSIMTTIETSRAASVIPVNIQTPTRIGDRLIVHAFVGVPKTLAF